MPPAPRLTHIGHSCHLIEMEGQRWLTDPSLLVPLAELGFKRVQLSHPWLTSASGRLQIGFTPAVHDVPQHSLSLAGAEARLLFCADTGFHEHWAEIRRRFQPSTALLPCDGTMLRWEPRLIMNAREAARAAIELGCSQLFQTHGDARYSDLLAEHLLSASDREPVDALRAALATEPGLSVPDFTPLVVGETRSLLIS